MDKDMDQSATDAAQHAATIATKAGYTVAGATAFFGLTLNEIGVIVGMFGTVTMILVTIYYNRKRHNLEKRRLEFDGVNVEGL